MKLDRPWYWRVWPLSRVWLRGYLAGLDEATEICVTAISGAEPNERSWSDMDAATAEADAARVLGSSEQEHTDG